MNYVVVASKDVPDEYRVEAIDDGEGAVYVAIFSGPNAKERALEYAEFKNEIALLYAGWTVEN